MNRDDRFVVCQPDGRIERLAEEGFFARDTRRVGLRGVPQWPAAGAPQRIAGPVLLVALRAPTQSCSTATASCPATVSGCASTGLSPAVSTRTTTSSTTGGAPFACDRDEIEIRLRRHLRRQVGKPSGGEINARWFRSTRELRTTYVHRDFVRELVIRADRSDSKPQFANGRFVFIAEVAPKGVWHTCLRWLPLTSSKRRPSTLACNAVAEPLPDQAMPKLRRVRLETPNHTVRRAWDQAQIAFEALADSTRHRARSAGSRCSR
jgi:hypothetical protein